MSHDSQVASRPFPDSCGAAAVGNRESGNGTTSPRAWHRRFPCHPSPPRPAPIRPVSIVAFAVAFLALSLVADKSAMFVGLSVVGRDSPRTVTGTEIEW